MHVKVTVEVLPFKGTELFSYSTDVTLKENMLKEQIIAANPKFGKGRKSPVPQFHSLNAD